MKRAFYILFVAVVLSGLVPAFPAAFGGGGRGALAPVAEAATPAPAASPAAGGGSDIKSDKCVKIGLPLVNGDNCIDNSASKGGAIIVYLRQLLKLLSYAIVMVIILMLVIAGIQYITSTGDQGAIKAAKDRIVNAITALVLFLMAYAILNFLVPGGIL